jgi:hypothetical protein
VRVALAEADDVVDDVLQAKVKHTCHHGGSYNAPVDGEVAGA